MNNRNDSELLGDTPPQGDSILGEWGFERPGRLMVLTKPSTWRSALLEMSANYEVRRTGRHLKNDLRQFTFVFNLKHLSMYASNK